MLQSFDIPVMIEYSSYEQHPLGKVEWVKFFGALTGKEAEAEEAFAEQTEILEKVESGEKTGKTIAFFYVTSNGLIQVRQSTDYIPKLIELFRGSLTFRAENYTFVYVHKIRNKREKPPMPTEIVAKVLDGIARILVQN